jgi:hypothetical protein
MSRAKLIAALMDAEKLLIECGWQDRAAWFKEKRSKVKSLAPASTEFREELKSLRGVLVRMGSFSDLPMHPRAGSDMTVLDAQNQQWELTERIGALVDELLRSDAKRA